VVREGNVNLTVGVSDAKVSSRRDDVLTTHALGSCIGVALYDAVAGVAGLLHFQLPTATLDADGAGKRPFMFADTGMHLLLKQMERLGANKKRLRVRLAGGAQILDERGHFDIGRKNHAAISKILGNYGMLIERESVGGTEPVTMQFRVDGGELVLKRGGQLTIL